MVRRSLRSLTSRRGADAAGTVTDAGPYGRLVAPARLDPSLVAPLGFSNQWTVPIPVGCAFFLFSTAAAGASRNATATFAGGGTLVLPIGSNGTAFLRAADGFVSVSSSASLLGGFLVVDTGSPSSYVSGGDYNTNPPTTYVGGGANAPQTGVWYFAATCAVAATYLTINNGGGAKKLAPIGVVAEASIEASVLYFFEYPVASGTAYTIGGGTVNDGTIE